MYKTKEIDDLSQINLVFLMIIGEHEFLNLV